MKKSSPYDTAKNLIAFFIVLLGFGILSLFYTYNNEIMLNGGSFYLFMSLATVCMGLLLGLLYLVNNQHPAHKHSNHKSSKKKRSR